MGKFSLFFTHICRRWQICLNRVPIPVLGLGFQEGAGLGVPVEEELEDTALLEVEGALLLELLPGVTELFSFLSEAT